MKSYRNDFTNRLIKKAKIEEGMRILDVDCGTGAISVLIGDKVGKDGEIIGVDIDRNVIKAAQENIHNEKIQFICADINNLPQLGKFDRIIGRQVLMYHNENTIKKLLPFLIDDGNILFQESDKGKLLVQEDFPLHSKIQKLIWKTIEKEGGNTSIGSQLYQLFKESELIVEEVFSEQVIQTSETGSDLGWQAKIMKPRMIKQDLVSKEYDFEELEQKLDTEMKNSRGIFIRDLNYGIIGRKK